MSDIHFVYPPSPAILQWLAAGQLGNRLQRSLRLWVLLSWFYGSESEGRETLPQPFAYPDLRDRLFSPTHPKSDQFSAESLVAACHDTACICHKSLKDWVFAVETHQDELQWSQAVKQMTGLSQTELEKQLQLCPFATVHRSLRDDLKQLKNLGWLRSSRSGKYQFCLAKNCPTPPAEISHSPHFAQLSQTQTWEVLRALQSVTFIQPDLELAVESLWKQVIANTPTALKFGQEPMQRIFMQFDYILPDDVQDRVDTYQEQLESLWRRQEGGIVQFKYWVVAQERQVQITTYPVCLHYVRRAKYLSAYGIDPDGNFGWHNYRLDRIISNRLKILVWGDPSIPKQLKDDWRAGQLPSPEQVKSYLEAAWGFNFYLPSALLIVRFSPQFSRWYVDDTVRHPTFKPIAYQKLPQLIRQQVESGEQQQQLLKILKERPATDAYYQGRIRLGDINVLMRLRDWRPNGEVIAPLSVRQRLKEEALQELSNYQDFES